MSKLLLIAVLDLLTVAGCYFFGLWLRFDFKFNDIPLYFLDDFLPNIALWCVIHLVVFAVFRLYNSIWRFASVDEFIRIMGAYLVLGVGNLLYILLSNHSMPYSFYILGYVYC